MTGPTLLAAIQEGVQAKFSLDKLLFHCSVPVHKHVIKKNGRKIMSHGGRLFPGKSDTLILMEKSLTMNFRAQANRQKLFAPIRCPIWVIFHFYFKHEDYFTRPKRKKDEPRMRLNIGDLTNLIQLPEDCLQSAGIIENDALICSLDLSRRIVGPETKLEVFILEMGNEWKSSQPSSKSTASAPQS
jgi:Holliday junction resolvase RusA-like endonuclease